MPKAKRRTYDESRALFVSVLAKNGWMTKPNLKVPQAISPDGFAKLWFKTQAVWSSRGTASSLGEAHSTLIPDIRDLTEEQMLYYANIQVQVYRGYR